MCVIFTLYSETEKHSFDRFYKFHSNEHSFNKFLAFPHDSISASHYDSFSFYAYILLFSVYYFSYFLLAFGMCFLRVKNTAFLFPKYTIKQFIFISDGNRSIFIYLGEIGS